MSADTGGFAPDTGRKVIRRRERPAGDRGGPEHPFNGAVGEGTAPHPAPASRNSNSVSQRGQILNARDRVPPHTRRVSKDVGNQRSDKAQVAGARGHAGKKQLRCPSCPLVSRWAPATCSLKSLKPQDHDFDAER